MDGMIMEISESSANNQIYKHYSAPLPCHYYVRLKIMRILRAGDFHSVPIRILTPGELRDGAASSSRPRQTREGDEDATKQ